MSSGEDPAAGSKPLRSTIEKKKDKKLKKRYPALRLISELYHMLAILAFVATIVILIVCFGLQLGGSDTAATPLFLLYAASSAIAGVTFLASSMAIRVFIDIEAYTRATYLVMESLKQGARQGTPEE